MLRSPSLWNTCVWIFTTESAVARSQLRPPTISSAEANESIFLVENCDFFHCSRESRIHSRFRISLPSWFVLCGKIRTSFMNLCTQGPTFTKGFYSWGLILSICCLDTLNNVIFVLVFCKWNLMGQWNIYGQCRALAQMQLICHLPWDDFLPDHDPTFTQKLLPPSVHGWYGCGSRKGQECVCRGHWDVGQGPGTYEGLHSPCGYPHAQGNMALKSK